MGVSELVLGFSPSRGEGKAKRPARPAEKQGRMGKERQADWAESRERRREKEKSIFSFF